MPELHHVTADNEIVPHLCEQLSNKHA